MICLGLWHFLGVTSSPLAPLFSHQGIRRHTPAEKNPHYPYGSWLTRGGCHLELSVTPVDVTHPCVSNHDEIALHLALWNGHVVSGHGSPVPLDSKNPPSFLVDLCLCTPATPHIRHTSRRAGKAMQSTLPLRRVDRTTPQKHKSNTRQNHAVDFALLESWPETEVERGDTQDSQGRDLG